MITQKRKNGGKIMEQMAKQIYKVLSPTQQQIFSLRAKNISFKDIAKELGCSPSTVKVQWHRIKAKAKYLRDNDIGINDIFDAENSRSLPSQLTVNQARFLANSKKMSCRQQKSSSTKRMMNKRLGISSAPKVTTRQMTEEEMAEIEITPSEPLPPKHILKMMKRYYEYEYEDDLIEQATVETILRSYGLLYRTPAVNKNNRKASMILRASSQDKQIVIVKPGEEDLLPREAKLVEIVENDIGETDYKIYLVPGKRQNFLPKN